MRKCIFILAFSLIWNVFSESGEISKYKSGQSATVKKYSGLSSASSSGKIFLPRKISVVSGVRFKSDIGKKSYSANLGAQFLFRDFELKAAYKIPETLFSQNIDRTETSFGARFSFNKIAKLPIELKAGNLSLGGSFQILKNPALSETVYALPIVPCTAGGIAVSLPSFSAAAKPCAASISFNLLNKNLLKAFSVSCFYNEKDIFAASINASIRAGKSGIIGCSGTAARTPLKKNAVCSGESFFSSYGRKWNFCAQTSFSSQYCGAKLSVCFFENLKSDFGKTYSFENFIKTGFFLLNTGVFYAPDKNTVTASLAKQKTLVQFKLNPQGTFFFAEDKIRLKTGAAVLLEEKRKTVRRKTFTAKLGAGFRLDCSTFTAKLNFKAENFYLADSIKSFAERGIRADNAKIFDSASYTVSASLFQNTGFYPFFAASAVFTPKGKNNLFTAQYKADASIRLSALVHADCDVKLSGGYSVKVCGGEFEKSSINMKITQTFRTGRIFIGGSLGIVYSY